MKILHLPNSFLPATTGGKEVLLFNLIKNLSGLGVQNHVAYHINEDLDFAPGDHFYNNIPIHILPKLPNGGKRIQIWKGKFNDIPGFESLLYEIKPDIVHFHDRNDGGSLTHLREVKKLGIKAIMTYHSPGQSCMQRALLYKGIRGNKICDGEIKVKRCTYCRLVAGGLPSSVAKSISNFDFPFIKDENNSSVGKLLTSRRMATYFRNSFNEYMSKLDAVQVHAKWSYEVMLKNNIPAHKLYYYPLGRWEKYEFEDQNRYPDRKVLRLAFIGRCTNIKGIHILIDAVKKIPENYPIEVFFFGPQWETSEYGKELKKKIGDDTRFRAPRMVPNSQLQDELENMDVCVIPSLWPETGPLTVFDAWAAGLAVIGSNAGGLAELITDNENGLLFERGSVEELKNKIIHVIDNPSILKKFGKANNYRTFRDFSMDIFSMYRSILNT